jgi:hypothetical protein
MNIWLTFFTVDTEAKQRFEARRAEIQNEKVVVEEERNKVKAQLESLQSEDTEFRNQWVRYCLYPTCFLK